MQPRSAPARKAPSFQRSALAFGGGGGGKAGPFFTRYLLTYYYVTTDYLACFYYHFWAFDWSCGHDGKFWEALGIWMDELDWMDDIVVFFGWLVGLFVCSLLFIHYYGTPVQIRKRQNYRAQCHPKSKVKLAHLLLSSESKLRLKIKLVPPPPPSPFPFQV